MNVPRNKNLINSTAIVNDLLTKIETLKYMPGEMISEGDLCATYDTTRHTVRGALAVLKEKGFVEVYPQRGTFVSLIDLEYIDDVLFLRESVEQEAVHRIIEKGENEKLVEKLRAEVKKQKAVKDPMANPPAFYKLDDAFHNAILEAAGRPKLSLLYEDSFVHVRRWRNFEVRYLNRIENLPKEHEEIIAVIEKRDFKAARKILNHHLDSVGRYGREMRKQYPEYFV